jgi:hypothetical protein
VGLFIKIFIQNFLRNAVSDTHPKARVAPFHKAVLDAHPQRSKASVALFHKVVLNTQPNARVALFYKVF